MNKLLIKWFSEIIKNGKGSAIYPAPRRRCHNHSEVYSYVAERWLLAKTNNVYNTYFIYYFQIHYSSSLE